MAGMIDTSCRAQHARKHRRNNYSAAVSPPAPRTQGGVDSPKSLSHPMGRKGKWWNLVILLAQLCRTWSDRAKGKSGNFKSW
jgi:hypothetical protein